MGGEGEIRAVRMDDPWAAARSMLRAWCLFAAIGAALPVVLDGVVGDFSAAGRLFLGSLLAFHLILVPGRAGASRIRGIPREAALFAVLALPPAAVVRGITGADWDRLPLVAGMLVLAHGIGAGVGRIGSRYPGFLRLAYWPLVLAAAAGLPLIVYAAQEFLALGPVPMDGAPFAPLVRLLDGGP
jgi:hypothetical protein